MNVNLHYDHVSDHAVGKINPATVKGIDNAYPTSRVLDGSSDAGYAEEWAEPAKLPDGRQCLKIYLFDDDDIVDSDGEPREPEWYPWDDEHVARVVVTD